MKKLVKIVYVPAICLILSLSFLDASASSEVMVMPTPDNKVVAKIVCLDGFKFAVVAQGGKTQAGGGVSIVQMFQKISSQYPPVPVTCGR